MIVDEVPLETRIRATEENLWTLWQRFGQGPECALHDVGGALWFDTPLKPLPYNGVLRFRPTKEAESLIDQIFDHYRDRNVPFMWVVHPSSSPADLSDLLEACGMTKVDTLPGMTMNLAELPPRELAPTGFEVREVTTNEDLIAAQQLIAWRWDIREESIQVHLDMTYAFRVGQPGSRLRCWIACIDGKPVSKVLLNLDAGVAGIHGVATKPEARGKGIARVLTLEALHAGKEAGFQLAMLHSSQMARNLYEKIGFRQVSEFKVFVSGAPFSV